MWNLKMPKTFKNNHLIVIYMGLKITIHSQYHSELIQEYEFYKLNLNLKQKCM